jgi:cytochrome c5
MKKFRLLISVAVVCILSVISCKTTKPKAASGNKAAEPSKVVLTYNGSIKNIIDNNCTSCHNNPEKKKGDFTNYAGLKFKTDNGTFKDRVIVQKDMPPRGPLSDEDYNTLKRWLEAGAPE